MSANRQFAIVTGASSGIGRELAKVCAREGFDLLIAADEPEIEAAAEEIRALGATVETVLADLATIEGVDRLVEAAKTLGRPVDALLAAGGGGRGPGVRHRHRKEHGMKRIFTREQRLTIVNGMLCIVLILVVLQLWLLI